MIGRWLSVDPRADERPWESPFGYTDNNPVNRTDKDGEFWGAIIGAAVEYAFQVHETGSWVPSAEGWAKIGVSAAAGALSGGLSSLTKAYKAGKIIAMVGNAALSAGEGAAKKAISGEQITAKSIVMDALVGGASTKLGEAVENTLTKQIQKVGEAGEALSKAEQKLAGLRKNSKTSRRTYRKNLGKVIQTKQEFRLSVKRATRAMTFENLGASNAASAAGGATASSVTRLMEKEDNK